MLKRIMFVLAVPLGVGLAGGLVRPACASVASDKKQFSAMVSDAGGATLFAQAAASGQGAAGLATPLQKLAKVAPVEIPEVDAQDVVDDLQRRRSGQEPQ